MKRRNKAALASLLAAANLSSTAMPLAHAEEEKIEDSPVIEEVYETPVPEMELVYETPVNEEPIVEQPPVQETPITHDNNSINEGNNDNNYDDYHLDPIGQEIVNIDDNNYDDILLKPNDQEIIEINNDDNNTNTDEDKLDDEEKVESEKNI